MKILLDTNDKISPTLLRELLKHFTREQLRQLARVLDIPRGREKKDTIENLVENQQEMNLIIDFSVGKYHDGDLKNLREHGKADVKGWQERQLFADHVEVVEDDSVAEEVVERSRQEARTETFRETSEAENTQSIPKAMKDLMDAEPRLTDEGRAKIAEILAQPPYTPEQLDPDGRAAHVSGLGLKVYPGTEVRNTVKKTVDLTDGTAVLQPREDTVPIPVLDPAIKGS